MSSNYSYDKYESRIKDLEKEVEEYKSRYVELLNKEAIFEFAIESIPFDFFVIDENGRYVFQNLAYKEHWGDSIGKRPEDLAGDKKTLSLLQSNNQRAFAGEIVKGEVSININGEEKYFFNIVSPFKKNNRVKYIYGFNIDITERKLAEKVLRESEERYRHLADLLPQVVFEIDKKGTVTFVNRRAFEMLGYSEDDSKKLPNALQLIIPEDQNRALSKIQAIMRGEKTEGNEYTALKKDGSTFPIMVYSSPIIKKEQVIGLRGIMIDLTEIKQAYKAIRENEEKIARLKKMEAMGLLAGGVAHDLNNVLSGVVSYPDLLLMDLPEDSDLRKPIEAIQDSGNRAVAIVQDLLALSRCAATDKKPININSIIQNYLSSLEFEELKLSHPLVTIKTNLGLKPFNINASDVHMRKVIMNLVSNASEAIDGRGNVVISTMNRYLDRPLKGYDNVKIGEYVVLSVCDDGSGISSDDLEKIFDPFYTKKVLGRSGTGLGLSVVWNVVRDHGGYIDVITGENCTTFELYFPITRDEVACGNSVVPINELKGSGEFILVIDDMENQREITCKMLDVLGYKNYAVSGGEEAIGYLKEHKADLILLDMIMDPGMSGFDTYREIIKINPKQKAFIVSGFAETDEVKKTQKLGAGQYVKKPLTIEKIGIAIKKELKK